MNEDRVVIQVAARDNNDDDISNQTTNTHNLNMSRVNDQLLQFDEDSVVNPEFQTSAISVDDNPVDMVTYTTTSSNTAASCQIGIQMARMGKLKLKRQSTLNGEIIGPTVSNSTYSKNSLNAVQV